MRKWLVAGGLAVLLCTIVLPRTALRSAEQMPRAEDELVGQVRAWLAAEMTNDRAALDRLISEDFIGTAFGGNVVTKGDILPADGGRPAWPKSTLRETTARAFGTTGVVMGRVAMEDAEHPGELRFTMVFIKNKSGWQMVAAHLTRTSPQ